MPNACCPCEGGPSQQCCHVRYAQPNGNTGDCGCIPYVIVTLPDADVCGDFECTGYKSGQWGPFECTGPDNSATYRWIPTGSAGGTFTLPATIWTPPFGGPPECVYMLEESVVWTDGCTGVTESYQIRSIFLRMSIGGGFGGGPPGLRFRLTATAPVYLSTYRCVLEASPNRLDYCGDRPGSIGCFNCDTSIAMPTPARCFEPFNLTNQQAEPFCGVCFPGAWIPAFGVGFRYPNSRGAPGSIATVTLGPPQ